MALSREQLKRAAQRQAHGQRARPPEVRTLPAPSGGWNARDAWDDMDLTDAIELENWFPGHGKVTVRPGSDTWATVDSTAAVETIAELNRSDGRHLLAASDDKLWDVTAGGTISSEEESGFSNDRWQWTVMNDVMGLVNGEDAPQVWDPTATDTVSAMTIAAASGEPALTVANLYGIHNFKTRSFFWEDNSQDFWYSAVNTLGGDLEQFPLGDVGSFGGKLATMATWTRDGGSGMDDFAVFVMSSGEAIIYQGSDPGDANDWSLVGIFQLGEPLGIRSWTKAGSDVLLITRDGYAPLSVAMRRARGVRGTTVSDKIAPAVIERAKATGDSFGWQALHYPLGRKLIINYPRGGSFEQHVANIDTGAWCKYRGLKAHCWALFDNKPFFGGDSGKVIEAETGTSDDGADITAYGAQAFSYLGTRSAVKQVRMVKPFLESGGSVPVRVGLASDFSPRSSAQVDATLNPAGQSGGKWDEGHWDVAKWGTPARSVAEWIGHNARGIAISPSLRIEQGSRSTSWAATSIMFDRVGAI